MTRSPATLDINLGSSNCRLEALDDAVDLARFQHARTVITSFSTAIAAVVTAEDLAQLQDLDAQAAAGAGPETGESGPAGINPVSAKTAGAEPPPERTWLAEQILSALTGRIFPAPVATPESCRTVDVMRAHAPEPDAISRIASLFSALADTATPFGVSLRDAIGDTSRAFSAEGIEQWLRNG
jgi:hypothetical protein